MRRVTVVPFGPWVTTVSTGSLVIWRLTAVWAWATAALDASANPTANVPMGLIAKPPVLASLLASNAPTSRWHGGSGTGVESAVALTENHGRVCGNVLSRHTPSDRPMT